MARRVAHRGERMSVRAPKDDEEARRARLKVALGGGRSIAEVIEEITGDAPDDRLVETVKERLKAAAVDGDAFDLAAFLREHAAWQEQWQ